MKITVLLIALFLKLTYIENKVIPYGKMPLDDDASSEEGNAESNDESKTNLKSWNQESGENDKFRDVDKKTCSILVLSNMQNSNMQSLLRKYRYDANGMLIPSSVKYYIKLPQGLHSPPILVPLNDKAYSPLGAFVRYYKEVPPIPLSW